MSVRRLVSVLSVCLVASATAVVAQPKGAKKKAPVAPAKDPATPAAPTPAPAGGSGSAAGSDAGSAVQMAEDPPPSDMEGTNENPDAPKTGEGSAEIKAVAPPMKKSGYPIEETQRPITLPQNMSEVGLAPHAQMKPYAGADAQVGLSDRASAAPDHVAAEHERGLDRTARAGLAVRRH